MLTQGTLGPQSVAAMPDLSRAGSDAKRKKQADALSRAGPSGGPSPGPATKTHLLIVQAQGHSVFVGDFLGLVEFFQKEVSPTFLGDFWTCWGPQEYFQQNPWQNDIKFDGRVILRRAEHWEPNYRAIDQDTICREVFQWIHQKSDPEYEYGAKPGDAVIIIILGHGEWDKEKTLAPVGIRLGNNVLLVDDFVVALRKFPRTIQVNVISTACYSAIFAQKISEDQQASRWTQVASFPGKEAWPADRSNSGRYQNSAFVAGLVRSLANLGRGNKITLGTLHASLGVYTGMAELPEHRSQPYGVSGSPADTSVESLLLRRFADFPFTTKNIAIRKRREIAIDMYQRPYPPGAAIVTKQAAAAVYIEQEHMSFGNQATRPVDDNFESLTRQDLSRRFHSGDILCGLLIRGRIQAATFTVFMSLCHQGKCSLSALEHPIDWNRTLPLPGTLMGWIVRMLATFQVFRTNWKVIQNKWGIKPNNQWIRYDTPMMWLAVMIGRTFTSLSDVFDIIRILGQFGEVDTAAYQDLINTFQPDPNWTADVNFYRANSNSRGSGTFAFWLPCEVSAGILNQEYGLAVDDLSQDFFKRVDKMERSYAAFFDISQDEFNRDILVEERDVRDWSY
jgi:hypothetical protein